MTSASVTALSWRPLPFLRPSWHAAGIDGILSSSARVSSTCCTSSRLPDNLSSVTSSRRRVKCSYRNLSLENSSILPSLDIRLKFSGSWNLERSRKRRVFGVTTTAGMRLDPSGGKNNNGGNGITRLVVNIALAGCLTYLTVTGKLGWVFDTLISLWLLAVFLPIVGIVAFLWFAEREVVRGACPNCGQAFQVFEFALKQKPNLCPYCSQPFKLDTGRQFVRDEPRFSNQRSSGFGNFGESFGGFGNFGRGASSTKDRDPGGVIVDVEAEVVDRD